MQEDPRIQIDGRWYVLATTARTEVDPKTLKRDDVFALFDRFGDIAPWDSGDQGLYVNDTRFLSRLELLLDGNRPLHLNTVVRDDGSVLAVELMNPDLHKGGQLIVPKGTVHLLRRKLLWNGACHEQVELSNHGMTPVRLELEVNFDADFVDLFEIRGAVRAARGDLLAPQLDDGTLVLAYDGLDQARRRTVIRFDPAPTVLEAKGARFAIALEAGAQARVSWQLAFEPPEEPAPAAMNYDEALARHLDLLERRAADRCRIVSSNPLMDRWIQRSVSDIDMLSTALPTGPYPYAGVPWFCTTFGRDALITAHQCLWLRADLARGVLVFLAASQATTVDPSTDAQPGKILHEARRGEMAATGEVPFARYYGSVDSTPLFVALAAAYWRRTGDLNLIASLWPNILAALNWIDEYGDHDKDGFVEYARSSDNGLIQQGWKDSNDSVFHADGNLAEAPVAICEVQGYVYAAKHGAAQLAEALGKTSLARTLRQQAETLKTRFQEAFWCEEIGLYALALDGNKRQCKVATSNAGHALWSGIASPEHARRMAQRLVEPDLFSGWGLRTLSSAEARYNPMSYHNGSIWPHDNSLVCEGLARYGEMDAALTLFSAAFDVSVEYESSRLPELFCGFPRRATEGPTRYPVACSPQAWAAATLFGMLGGCLGMQPEPMDGRLRLFTPRLPTFLDWIRIEGLDIGGKRVDLLLQRYEESTGVEVTKRDEGIRVAVVV